MRAPTPTVGPLLRSWRERRRISQLELSLRTDVSTRHISFVETGRSLPSRAMLDVLTDELDVPLRERNRLLLAAGYAPRYPERSLAAPAMATVRTVLGHILRGHDPNPTVVLDAHWNLLQANASSRLLTELIDDELLQPPVNVLRATLHPLGLSRHIVNLPQWRAHLVHRLARQVEVTGDPRSQELLTELRDYPGGELALDATQLTAADIAVPLRLSVAGTELSFISTVTSFGTPLDVTVSELSIESFFPADAATAEALQALASASTPVDPQDTTVTGR